MPLDNDCSDKVSCAQEVSIDMDDADRGNVSIRAGFHSGPVGAFNSQNPSLSPSTLDASVFVSPAIR
jgi:hypothetical protein